MTKEQLTKLIGENICKYREKAGLTQAQLAEKVGVGTPFVSRVERGEKSMKLFILYTIAEALEISCAALLYPESSSVQLNAIMRLLENRSTSDLKGIEETIRTCDKYFFHHIEDQLRE